MATARPERPAGRHEALRVDVATGQGMFIERHRGGVAAGLRRLSAAEAEPEIVGDEHIGSAAAEHLDLLQRVGQALGIAVEIEHRWPVGWLLAERQGGRAEKGGDGLAGRGAKRKPLAAGGKFVLGVFGALCAHAGEDQGDLLLGEGVGGGGGRGGGGRVGESPSANG